MTGVAPPVAPKIPHETKIHGEILTDDYYWMRDKKDKKIIDYLEAENAHTRSRMRHTTVLQKILYDEMLGRIKEDDNSVPYRKGGYWYYTRTEKGKAYKIYCRKKGSIESKEEILLDANKLAEGNEFMRLGAVEVSPNHALLAYSVDYNGSERHTLHVRDINTGKVLDEKIEDTYYSVVWANDNKTIFYSTVDETSRPDKLWRHNLGNDPKKDEMVVYEPDDHFYLSAYRTRSDAYILVGLDSAVTSEVLFLDANKPDGKFQIVKKRKNQVEYAVDHHDKHFLILTNEDAFNFKLVSAPVAEIGDPDAWTEVIAHRDKVTLKDVAAFKDYWVIVEREDGLPQLRVRKLDNKVEHRVEMEDPTYALWLDDNHEYETSTLRFGYSSLVRPESIFDYDMKARKRELKKEHPVIGFDGSKYTSERIFAKATDGTKIPISLVYAKTTSRDGTAPFLLHGYGSYGYSYDPYFSANWLSLLDRGFVVGIAHIRGGGEMGRRWKEDGKFEKKINSFTDFIACGEHLIAVKYTSADRLAISGRSAGGLLMGAVTNMRPDLFKAVVAGVPFVDIINTMLDETIPLTVIEWEEWGNPNEEKAYRTMKAYSPYDNVAVQDYPNLLITAGLNDPRVAYWEPAKWTTKLRTLKTGASMLLLKTNMGAGHGGKSGRYGRLEDRAFEYAFILDQLGAVRAGED